MVSLSDVDRTLLIVEDDPSNYLFLESAYSRVFKRILHAASGIQAVELCRENSDIGLVLMDIGLPGMNGYDATRIIRKTRPDLIILALTAYISDDTVQLLREAGFSDYLFKPFHLDELNRKIESFLKDQARLNPKPDKSK